MDKKIPNINLVFSETTKEIYFEYNTKLHLTINISLKSRNKRTIDLISVDKLSDATNFIIGLNTLSYIQIIKKVKTLFKSHNYYVKDIRFNDYDPSLFNDLSNNYDWIDEIFETKIKHITVYLNSHMYAKYMGITVNNTTMRYAINRNLIKYIYEADNVFKLTDICKKNLYEIFCNADKGNDISNLDTKFENLRILKLKNHNSLSLEDLHFLPQLMKLNIIVDIYSNYNVNKCIIAPFHHINTAKNLTILKMNFCSDVTTDHSISLLKVLEKNETIIELSLICDSVISAQSIFFLIQNNTIIEKLTCSRLDVINLTIFEYLTINTTLKKFKIINKYFSIGTPQNDLSVVLNYIDFRLREYQHVPKIILQQVFNINILPKTMNDLIQKYYYTKNIFPLLDYDYYHNIQLRKNYKTYNKTLIKRSLKN